jgi:hypothetical protein
MLVRPGLDCSVIFLRAIETGCCLLLLPLRCGQPVTCHASATILRLVHRAATNSTLSRFYHE